MKKFLKCKLEADESYKNAIVSKTQEITDSEFSDILFSPMLEIQSQRSPLSVHKWNRELTNKNIPVCKEYLKNDCTSTICDFRHNILMEDLPNLYEFCIDYQNTTCTRRPCKFIHATVMEQEWFYKTGFLPEHIRPELEKYVFGLTTLDKRQGNMPKYMKITPSDQLEVSNDIKINPERVFEQKIIKKEWEDIYNDYGQEVIEENSQQDTKSIFQTGSRDFFPHNNDQQAVEDDPQNEVIQTVPSENRQLITNVLLPDQEIENTYTTQSSIIKDTYTNTMEFHQPYDASRLGNAYSWEDTVAAPSFPSYQTLNRRYRSKLQTFSFLTKKKEENEKKIETLDKQQTALAVLIHALMKVVCLGEQSTGMTYQ